MSVAEHDIHLLEVMRRLNQFNFRIKPSKCHWYRPEIHYLGHVIGNGMIRRAPPKILDVQGLERPTTGKQVQSLLGTINYLRHFMVIATRFA